MMASGPEPPLTPLRGVRVLDLSRYLPGPLLTRILADLGAEVVKVEELTGDPTRYAPPSSQGQGAVFSALNHGKASVALDLKRPEGHQVCGALIRGADVVVESFRPGVLQRLGLDFAAMQALNPRVILCSLSGYGQKGPLRRRAGHDLNYVARAGVLALCAQGTEGVVTPGVQLADVSGALTAATAVLAAVLERATTGSGRHLDISLTQSAAAFLALEGPRRGVMPEPVGEGILSGGLPGYRVYATKDGRAMALAALEPKFFAAFCERAGVAHLAADVFVSEERRREVIAELEALFRTRTQSEWVELLANTDCCCEPVRLPEEAAVDDELGQAWCAPLGVATRRTHLGAPLAEVSLEVPALGEDSRRVCERWGVPPSLVETALAAAAMVDGAGP